MESSDRGVSTQWWFTTRFINEAEISDSMKISSLRLLKPYHELANLRLVKRSVLLFSILAGHTVVPQCARIRSLPCPVPMRSQVRSTET